MKRGTRNIWMIDFHYFSIYNLYIPAIQSIYKSFDFMKFDLISLWATFFCNMYKLISNHKNFPGFFIGFRFGFLQKLTGSGPRMSYSAQEICLSAKYHIMSYLSTILVYMPLTYFWSMYWPHYVPNHQCHGTNLFKEISDRARNWFTYLIFSQLTLFIISLILKMDLWALKNLIKS